MSDPRRAALLILGLVGICALLVIVASRAASQRGALESGEAPISTATAGYAVDSGTPLMAPLDYEVIEAASSDRKHLGSQRTAAAPPRLDASPDEAGLTSQPPAAPLEVGGRGAAPGIAWTPIIVAILLVGAGTCAVYLMARPRLA